MNIDPIILESTSDRKVLKFDKISISCTVVSAEVYQHFWRCVAIIFGAILPSLPGHRWRFGVTFCANFGVIFCAKFDDTFCATNLNALFRAIKCNLKNDDFSPQQYILILFIFLFVCLSSIYLLCSSSHFTFTSSSFIVFNYYSDDLLRFRCGSWTRVRGTWTLRARVSCICAGASGAFAGPSSWGRARAASRRAWTSRSSRLTTSLSLHELK